MTPGSAGTASGSYRAEPEPRDEAAEELREALARKLSTWVIGVAYENSWLCADALLSGPLAPLLEKLRAVEELITFYDRHEYSTLNVDDLRQILGAAS